MTVNAHGRLTHVVRYCKGCFSTVLANPGNAGKYINKSFMLNSYFQCSFAFSSINRLDAAYVSIAMFSTDRVKRLKAEGFAASCQTNGDGLNKDLDAARKTG